MSSPRISAEQIQPVLDHTNKRVDTANSSSTVDQAGKDTDDVEKSPIRRGGRGGGGGGGGLLYILGLRDPPPDSATVWNGNQPDWFRSTFTQTTILGMCSFLAPGIWGAMAALGAGGSQDPSTVNAANSLTFGLMVITSGLNPILVKFTSIKFALIFGTLGFAPYAAGLYLNSKNQTQWLIILGAALCGISAGVFWSAEGTIILTYPELYKRARSISYWLMFRVLGQFLGGVINLSLNFDQKQAGSISTNTYLVFVILQAICPFMAMLLALPHQVQRKDKTLVSLDDTNITIKQECKQIWKSIISSPLVYLVPMIWQTTWSEALIGTFAVTHFTVRSRALGSLLSAICASLANYLVGFYLDSKQFSFNRRAKTCFIVMYTLQFGYYIWAIYIMNQLNHPTDQIILDWSCPGYGKSFAVYLFLQIGFNTMYNLTYWIVGSLSDDTLQIIRLASTVRGIESAGQCVSYGINSTGLRLDVVAAINFGQCLVAIPPAWYVIRSLGVVVEKPK